MIGANRSATRPTAMMWVDIAVVMVLSTVAVVGFEPAFGHFGYLTAAIGGLVVGCGVALIGNLLRFSVLTTIALVIAAYFVFGTALTMPAQALYGVLPSLDGLSGLVLGAVFGWSDAITLQAPVEAPPYIAVVPYFAAWVVAFVTV